MKSGQAVNQGEQKAEKTGSRHRNIRKDPFVKNLMQRMPADIVKSFSDEQLMALKVALGARSWGNHGLDIRGTVRLFSWRYYYVILGGRNRRELSRREKQISGLIQAGMLALFITFSTLASLLILYLLKSALGINIFPNFSFGIWEWFKALFH